MDFTGKAAISYKLGRWVPTGIQQPAVDSQWIMFREVVHSRADNDGWLKLKCGPNVLVRGVQESSINPYGLVSSR